MSDAKHMPIYIDSKRKQYKINAIYITNLADRYYDENKDNIFAAKVGSRLK